MSLLSASKQIDFKINKDQYRIVEVKVSEGLHLGTVICLTERWNWKQDTKRIDPDIFQFVGPTSENVFEQCNEFLRITSAKYIDISDRIG